MPPNETPGRALAAGILVGDWYADYPGAMEAAAVRFAADGTGHSEHARPMVEEREHFTWTAEGDRLHLVFHRYTCVIGDVVDDDHPIEAEWEGTWRVEGDELIVDPLLGEDDRYTRAG